LKDASDNVKQPGGTLSKCPDGEKCSADTISFTKEKAPAVESELALMLHQLMDCLVLSPCGQMEKL
jgi:hypothetical protein